MKKNKKIAIVSTEAITINAFMLGHIKKLSHHYNLLIFCNNAESLKRLLPKSVSLTNINFRRKPDLINDTVTFLLLLYYLIKNKPDLTISLSPKAGLLTALSSFLARIPYRIHWFTGQIWIKKISIFNFIYKTLDKLIHYLSHHVLVDSHSQKKFLLSNRVISNEKSTVLHLGSVGGVNTKRFKYKKIYRKLLRKKLQIPQNDFIFLYLGRINREKGIIELIEAFNKIEKNKKNIFLVLVGPIENDSFIDLIKKNKKVIYINKTSVPEKWYSIADIFCLPSHREGFGSVIIEAGSCNLPSLGSNIYGITDAIVNNKTGFFHKVGNIKDIQKKMLFAFKNKKLLKKYGKYARKRVKKNFEEKLISEKFLKFINLKLIKI